jgi:hypothetical protein
MWAAERRKADIETALAEVPEQKIALHPNALARYRHMVDELCANVRRPEDAKPAREVSFGHGRCSLCPLTREDRPNRMA